MNSDFPMPPDRFAKLVARHGAASRPDPLVPVPVREPATETSELGTVDVTAITPRRQYNSSRRRSLHTEICIVPTIGSF